MRNAVGRFFVIAGIVPFSVAAFGVDPPDLRVNTVSGLIETVDATWSGSNFNVRLTEVTSAGQLTSSLLVTANAANDLDPRVAVTPGGDALIVWWRDLMTDALVYRKRITATGVWGPERLVGMLSESSSHPRLAYADKAWVAYEIKNKKDRSVACQVIDDDPEPIRNIIATTSYTGDLDIQLNAESGHLWVTWIDGPSRVVYAEYVYSRQLWNVPLQESDPEGSISAARERIRERVLGL
jgi:hypothetical protein